MNRREESRDEWSPETIRTQQNTAPVEAPWAAHYMAKKGFNAPIEDLACFVKLVFAGISVTAGISVLSSALPHSTEFGIAAVAAGCYFGWSGFRWNHNSN